MKNHRHQKRVEQDVPFRHCVSPDKCTPASHGNIMRIVVCRCGAVRLENINQQHIETGHWEESPA